MQSMSIAVLYSLWAIVPFVIALLAIRPVSERELSTFAGRYGLAINPETLPAITRSVQHNRTGRLAGAALGLSLYPVLSAVGVGIPDLSVAYGFVGYLLGAFVTAVVSDSPYHHQQRRASLVPRRPSDYLPRGALVMPAVAIVVSALAVIIYVLEPRRTAISFSGSLDGIFAAIAAGGATLVAIRVVVARPQPLTTPALAAVDDAKRTQALHTLAGAGIAIGLVGAAACLFQMGGYAAPGWLHATGAIFGVCALGGAVSAWMFRGRAWRVQRTMLR
jgi:hypothetical protein